MKEHVEVCSVPVGKTAGESKDGRIEIRVEKCMELVSRKAAIVLI